ncbi:hypothetical protein [Azospirillum thermophilum]|uniref:Molecular chaperone DnaJ n=1 Tax=Azospirillum thermophilum TaxID=2202148 RepID=A0A2S2CRR6_9PROT|nr:hypothetical protein [Azospirillum thermophilum]AWK87213.1 hypothetical protein DEW08_14175 [Azospirillum thermophilum]
MTNQKTGDEGRRVVVPAQPGSAVGRGDESVPGTRQTGEAPCPDCGGSGRLGGQSCPTCGGSGRITAIVGDA